MISIRHSREYCEEYWKIENYEKAISSDERWQCHHKLEFMPFSGKNVSKKFLIEQGMYSTTGEMITLDPFYTPNKVIIEKIITTLFSLHPESSK